MAAWQDEVGEHCVTGVVSLAMSDEGSDVHFEAFQASAALPFASCLLHTNHEGKRLISLAGGA